MFRRAHNAEIMRLSEARRAQSPQTGSLFRILSELPRLFNTNANISAMHNPAARFQTLQFEISFLWHELFEAGEKLYLRWSGPRLLIMAQKDHIFTVEDLWNGKKEEVHAI